MEVMCLPAYERWKQEPWCELCDVGFSVWKPTCSRVPQKNFVVVQVQFGNLLHFFRPKKQTQRLCMELLECVVWVQIGIKGKVQKIRSGNQLQDLSIMFMGAEMVAGRKSVRNMFFFDASQFDLEISTRALHACKKIYVTRSFTTRAVFRIAHGHLSRRNNGNKRPGVQVFQVMLCTTWWDAVVRPWISDPNETMMSCLAWLGKDVEKPTIDTNMSKTYYAETLWPCTIIYKEVCMT